MDQNKVDTKPKHKLQFGQLEVKNIEIYKLLNELTLPIKYSQNFYYSIIKYQKLSRMAYYNDILVGSIICREDKFEEENSVYIMTFGVIKEYRRFGFGTQLLKEIEKYVLENPHITCIYLHMWTENQDGYEFYMRHGFENKETIKDYYKEIEKPDCHVLIKKFNQKTKENDNQ